MSSSEHSEETPEPHQRLNLVGHAQTERKLRRLLDTGNLTNGWLITGAAGIGKATLAYRIVRAFLSPEALLDADTLQVSGDNHQVRLVLSEAHPDLFVAQRAWDEKNDRRFSEITVETIRKMIEFTHRTSTAGRKVCIIDKADELNRNAANALLKILEEPPNNALFLLLANSPGRLLPTIRSRCRQMSLVPMDTDAVAAFLSEEIVLEHDAYGTLARASGGRPGYALKMALEDGAAAATLVDNFLKALTSGGALPPIAEKVTGKATDALWRQFVPMLVQRISDAARSAAVGDIDAPDPHLRKYSPHTLMKVWEKVTELTDTGAGLNSDRGQILTVLGIELGTFLTGAHNAR